MIHRVVAIGGPPGSGKSTAGRRVASALHLEYCSAGDRFREEARARGLSLEEFGRYAEAHPDVDRGLDEFMQRRAKAGALLDGRIQGPLCRRAGTPVHGITVTAEEAVRARRVADRDGVPVPRALAEIRSREASERARYLRYYGIDLDREPSDLTVDSTETPPDGVVTAILKFLEAAEGAGP